MDATTWKRAGWLTAGVEQVVEVDGVVVQVVAHTNGLHVQHATGMAYRITTTTAPTRAGCRMAWLCPVCGARCNRLGMAGLMLGCGACCKLAKRTTPPPESRAINTRHSAYQRQQAGQELARVVWDWVTASTNKRTKKQRNKEMNAALCRRVSVAHARVRGPMLRWNWPVWCWAGWLPGRAQKVLPRCADARGNAGAWFGSFSASIGSCLDRPRPAKNSADVQRAHYTARRAKIREALTPSAPTEWQEEGEVEESGNEIPTLSQPKPKTGRGIAAAPWADVGRGGGEKRMGGSGRSTTVQRPFSGRSELSVAQRAHYSKRRKEIWEALHPEPSVDYGREDGEDEENNSGASCATIPGRSPGRPKQFAAATAEVTGQSKAQINRNVARAEAIGDDLLRLTGTSQRVGRLCPPIARGSQNATPLSN